MALRALSCAMVAQYAISEEIDIMAIDLARALIARGPIPVDALTLREARQFQALHRRRNGAAGISARLLTTPEENVKLSKDGDAPSWSLALAHAVTSMLLNVCRFSTPQCRAHCVAGAGNGRYDSVKQGRVRKTLFLYEHPEAFMTILWHELRQLPAGSRVRLNAFADLPWETICPILFTLDLKFYDYTKWPTRVGWLLPNYRVTYSASERTDNDTIRTLCAKGATVAVVFDITRGWDLPMTYLGVRVIDGDKTDNRYDDPDGVVVGLRAKGSLASAENVTFKR